MIFKPCTLKTKYKILFYIPRFYIVAAINFKVIKYDEMPILCRTQSWYWSIKIQDGMDTSARHCLYLGDKKNKNTFNHISCHQFSPFLLLGFIFIGLSHHLGLKSTGSDTQTWDYCWTKIKSCHKKIYKFPIIHSKAKNDKAQVEAETIVSKGIWNKTSTKPNM